MTNPDQVSLDEMNWSNLSGLSQLNEKQIEANREPTKQELFKLIGKFKQQNQKLIEALEEIANYPCNANEAKMTAQQALDEVDSYDNTND